MKKIKIIDLLINKVKGGEVPNRIKYRDVEYEYNPVEEDYFNNEKRFGLLDKIKMFSQLNHEVEIIEEEKEIERLKIEYDDGDIAIDGVYLTSNHSEVFANKINELIDAVNELKGKSE